MVAALARLDRIRQAAFAAACAERLMPAYRKFHETTGHGDPTTLRRLLDTVWAQMERGEEPVIESGEKRLDALAPRESDPWSVEAGLAENAAASVGYAVDVLTKGGPQDAAWAARQVYEAVDLWVRTRDDVDFNVEGAEDAVAADPLIQAELRRQSRDLRELADGDENLRPGLVTRLKTRADREARELLAPADP